MRQWLRSFFRGSEETGDSADSLAREHDARHAANGTPASGLSGGSDGPPAESAEGAPGGATSAEEEEGMVVSISPEKDEGPIAGLEYTIRTKEEPSPDRPFAHGVVDGIEGIDQEPFERFLTQNSEQGRLQEKLKALQEGEAKLQSAEETRLECEAQAERKKQRLADLKEEEERRRTRYERLGEQVPDRPSEESGLPGGSETGADEEAKNANGADTEAEEAPERGSVAYALLYSTAGLLFVAGDVIMSREVVSRALRLKGDAEPWIFAIGLAMLAVLMKPAYDRLVEKPYWNGQTSVFRWTILGGVVAAAVTLGVLGAFRADAFETRREISRVQEKLQRGVEEGTLSRSEVASLREKRVSLQQSIAGSRLGFWSFVLSGVLFAAAGAVCLGIGLRHGRDWYHRSARPLLRRWWRVSRRRRARRQLRTRWREAEEAYQTLRKRRARLESDLRAEKKRLEKSRSLDEIRSDLQEVRQEKERIQAQLWVGAGHEGIEAYRNGYDLADSAFNKKDPTASEARPSNTQRRAQGHQNPPSGEAASDGETLPEGGRAAGDEPSGDERSTGEEKSARRPFLAVRDAISQKSID